MRENKRESIIKYIGMALFAAAAGIALWMALSGLSNAIWFDELFTMGFTARPAGEIVSLTARDVHPPLYYLIVRAGITLVRSVAPAADPVVTAKLLSLLPFFLLLLLLAGRFRKEHGWFAAGLSAFLLLCMPKMLPYSVEIRMYSWALFFITAMYLHFMGACKYGEAADWILFTLYGICAAYTHYFAAVAAAALYLCLLFYLLRERRSQLKLWLAGGAVTALAYLPWVMVVLRQVARVRENYWILPLTWKSIFGCVKFLFLPSAGGRTSAYVLACLLIAVYGAGLLWRLIRHREERLQNFLAMSGMLTLCLTAAFGIIVSFLLRPVFIYRYLLPAAGCFWICFALCLTRLMREGKAYRIAAAAAVCLVVFTGLRESRAAVGNEKWTTLQMENTRQNAFQKISPQDVLLFNFDQLQGVSRYYLENESYLWGGQAEELIEEMYGPFGSLEEASEVKRLVKESEGRGSTVWFLGSGNAREEILELWEQAGVGAKEEGSYLIETYWFDLYRLEPDGTAVG